MHRRLWTPLVVFLATLPLSESVKIHSGDVLASMRVAGRIVNKHLRLDEEVLSLGGGSFQRILDWIPSSTKVSVSIPNFHIKEPLSIRKPVHIASEDSQMTISCSGIRIKSDGVTLVGAKVLEGCWINKDRSIFFMHYVKDIHLEDIVCSGVTNHNGPGCMRILNSDATLENVRGSDNVNLAKQGGGFLRAWKSRVTLNQCTFTGNRAHGTGGAVRATEGDLTVSKSTFINNSAEPYSQSSGGGGLYAFHECLCNDEHITFKRLINLHVHKGGEYEVFDSTFVGNTAISGSGGGAHIRGHKIKVKNSFFEGNTAEYRGGGLLAQGCERQCSHSYTTELVGTVEISGCQFTGNSAGKYFGLGGGGGVFSLAEEIKVSNSNFEDNIVDYHGGGLYSWAQTLTVSSCNFVNNTAIKRGGGLRTFILEHGSSHVNNCTFVNNAAIELEGGGVYCSGTAQELSLSGVIFKGNTAKGGSGGAIWSHVPELSIADSIFHDNTAKIEGGAILTNASSMALYESMFFMNTAPRGGGISASEDTVTLSAEVIFVHSPTSPPLPLRNEPKPRQLDSAT